MIHIRPIPCDHIAMYYAHKIEKEGISLGLKLLWQGYAQCSMGRIQRGFNNLFQRPTLALPVNR